MCEECDENRMERTREGKWVGGLTQASFSGRSRRCNSNLRGYDSSAGVWIIPEMARWMLAATSQAIFGRAGLRRGAGGGGDFKVLVAWIETSVAG